MKICLSSFCLLAILSVGRGNVAEGLRDLRALRPASIPAFPYVVARPTESGKGFGILLKKGESYPVTSSLEGPCAVYVSFITPSPRVLASWGDEKRRIEANERYYLEAGPFPPLDTIDAEGKLYGRSPARDGELISQELFAGVGEFRHGPLVITSAEGTAKITRVRIEKLTPAEFELATSKANPKANRRIIHNNDGFSHKFGDPRWDYRRLLDQIDIYADSDVKQLDWAPLVSGAVAYPSKYADWFGEGITEWAREFERVAAENYRKLQKNGMPLYPTLVQRGKEIGVDVWGSLRMSAYYGENAYGRAFNGTLWRQHPEFVIRNKEGKTDGAMRLSWAWRPVQEQRLGVLAEMVEMGCAGVNLDFCRYPGILGYDAPLIEAFQAQYGEDPRTLAKDDERWVRLRCEVVNGVFRELRSRLKKLGEERGKPVRVSVRLSAAGYEEYGLDPRTWVREGLVDLLIVGWPSVDKPYDLKPWREIVAGSDVELYGHIEKFIHRGKRHELTDAQIREGLRPDSDTYYQTEDYLRRAHFLYEAGADGLYLFNNFGSSRPGTLNLLGDKRSVQRWSRFEDPMNLQSEAIKITGSLQYPATP